MLPVQINGEDLRQEAAKPFSFYRQKNYVLFHHIYYNPGAAKATDK